MKNINPMLNGSGRQLKPHKKHKVRADKKVDIRVPITDEDREFVLWNSRVNKESMTAFCTNLVRRQIQTKREFNPHPYAQTDFIVHIKAEKELYEDIVDYSVQWSCSIREAAHRILTDSLFFIKGGVYIEGV